MMAGQEDTAGQQRANRPQLERQSADDAGHVDAIAEPRQGELAGARAEPPCLRDHILPTLNLLAEANLPVHLLGEKPLIRFDVDDNQNRLFLYQWGDGSLLRRLLESLVQHRAVAWGLRLFRSKPRGVAVIKGSGYIDFVRRCGLKRKDVIEISAFRQKSGLGDGREICTCDDSPLYLAIIQKDQRTMCSPCSLLMCCHN